MDEYILEIVRLAWVDEKNGLILREFGGSVNNLNVFQSRPLAKIAVKFEGHAGLKPNMFE